jgi:hypothetical protein
MQRMRQTEWRAVKAFNAQLQQLDDLERGVGVVLFIERVSIL